MTAFASVLEAVASQTSKVPAGEDCPVARGDVRVVEPLPWAGGRNRLAVVRGVDSDRGTVEVMLVHPYAELATDTDAVLAPEDSGLPHPLVVECYVRDHVWSRQVGAKVGALDEAQLEAIGRAVVHRDVSAPCPDVGLPLAGFCDPRWRSKRQEVRELRALTHDCTTVLRAGDEPEPLDAKRLPPARSAGGGDDAWSDEVLHVLATRPVSLALDGLDPCSLDPQAWMDVHGRDLGLWAYNSHRPALDRALAAQGATA